MHLIRNSLSHLFGSIQHCVLNLPPLSHGPVDILTHTARSLLHAWIRDFILNRNQGSKRNACNMISLIVSIQVNLQIFFVHSMDNVYFYLNSTAILLSFKHLYCIFHPTAHPLFWLVHRAHQEGF